MYDDFEDDWAVEAAENSPASPKQLAFLKRLGHPGPWNLTTTEASDLIDCYLDSKNAGLDPPDKKEIAQILGRDGSSKAAAGLFGGSKKKKTAHKKRGCLLSFIVWTWRFFWILIIALGLCTLGLFV